MNWKIAVHYLGFAAVTGCTYDFTSIEKMQSASVTCHIFPYDGLKNKRYF